MKKSLLFLSALLVLALAMFNACKKSDDTDSNADVEAAQDMAAGEDLIAQVDLDLDQAVEERGGGSGNTCPVVTFAQPQGTWPNTITIDYGTACTRPDGRVLSGKIIVNQSAELFTAGSVRTVSFDNFYADGVKVEGTKTWTNTSAGATYSFTKTASNMKLTFEDGTTTTWNHTHTAVLTEGGSTPTHFDNVWNITGSTSGVNRQGNSFSSTITQPLVKKATCRWITQGVVTFTRGSNTSTLDYGDGGCDRFGNVTLANGNSFTIRLRR